MDLNVEVFFSDHDQFGSIYFVCTQILPEIRLWQNAQRWHPKMVPDNQAHHLKDV
jgi:hypothetical protein